MRHVLVLTLLAPLAGAQMICGDCDGNGAITVLDALVAAQIAAGITTPTPVQQALCDVQGDIDVDVVDALRLAQEAAGLTPGLTCPDTRPVAQNCMGPALLTGTGPIDYELMDLDMSPADVTVEVSTDGGSTWQPATQGAGGDPVTGLTTSGVPTPYQFSWDSAADVDYAVGVQVQVTPSDAGGPGTPCVATVDVDNNTAPAVSGCALLPGGYAARYVYTNPDNSPDVPGFSIDPATGTLSPLAGSPYNRGVAGGGGTTNARSVTQLGGYLYVASIGVGVVGFTVNPATGDLTVIPGSPFLAPGTSCWSVDPDERRGFLAVVRGGICVMQQNPSTGALTSTWNTSISSALGVRWHPTNDCVYVSNGWNMLRGYNVNGSGVGVELPGSPYPSSGYAHTIRVNSAGTLLFTDLLTDGVDVWDISPVDGSLTLHPGSPFSAPGMSSSLGIALDEVHDRVILGARSGSQIAIFTGLASGNLVFQQTVPSGGSNPVHVDVADGRIFVCNEGTPVHVLDFPPTGTPTPVPGSPFTPVGATSGTSSMHVFQVPVTTGTAMLVFSLDDAESHTCSILVEWSTDGIAWTPATQGPGGDPTTGLTTVAGTPQTYAFEWDWTADLGAGGSATAYVTLTPSDPYTTGVPCQVGPQAVP
jgi:hypothetical protein